MSQHIIEALLKNKIGLDNNIIGSQEISRLIERRRIASNSPNLETYLNFLQTSAAELDELIEEVIVPETWFFRDSEPFNFLSHYVKSEWLANSGYRPLSLLSIPCSSGEEPYSIAMTLLDAGLNANQFSIDAIDISKKSLKKAKKALYSRNSFRVQNLLFRDRYFTQIGEDYQLCDLVKNNVDFMYGNLVDPNLLANGKKYDVIFCRNVLIYFDTSARQQSISKLNDLLIDNGLLFLGYSETSEIIDYGFESVRHPMAFAYRKIDKKPGGKPKKGLNFGGGLVEKNNNYNPPTPKAKSNFLNDRTQGRENRLSQPAKPFQISSKPEPEQNYSSTKIAVGDRNHKQPIPVNPISPESIKLENIRNLADGGNLNEAATQCEAYLKENSTHVEAYLLLGEIYQATGQEIKAEQCFQKAIYLEPNHYEALLHLALLKEQHGEMAKAAVLRQRIERLPKLV